jgi:hypothetical protein
VSLAKKLNLKDGMTLRALGKPPGFDFDDVKLTSSSKADAVFVFVKTLAEVDAKCEPVIAAAKADRLAWVAYPKAGQLGTDLNRDVLWRHLTKSGVQGVRQIAADSVWSAMRFRPLTPARAQAEKIAGAKLEKTARAQPGSSARAEAEPELPPEFLRIVKALGKEDGVTYGGKGFGSSALKADGRIFAMLSSKGRFVVKLSKARVAELSARGQGEPFDPGRGRLMKEWLAVSAPPKQWLGLAKEALAFARG